MLLRSGAWKMMAMTMVMMTMTLMMMMLVIAMTRQRRPEIPSARGSCHLVALRVSRRQDLSGIRLRAKHLFETAVQTRADPPAASPGRLALPAEAA